VEAKRIDLAFLFDPMMAVHTAAIDPLPHQITAAYESMLPRQPLRFVLADDPGAGKTIMAGLYIRELEAASPSGNPFECERVAPNHPCDGRSPVAVRWRWAAVRMLCPKVGKAAQDVACFGGDAERVIEAIVGEAIYFFAWVRLAGCVNPEHGMVVRGTNVGEQQQCVLDVQTGLFAYLANHRSEVCFARLDPAAWKGRGHKTHNS
jgi:hypothetical protein